MPKKILFLDDMPERVPLLPRDFEVFYARNAREFVDWLEANGTPDIISFDHDLAQEHYTGVKSGGYGVPSAETGEDCARWCLANNYVPERVIVHSWNSHGASRIAQRFITGGHKDVFVKPFNPKKRHDWRE